MFSVNFDSSVDKNNLSWVSVRMDFSNPDNFRTVHFAPASTTAHESDSTIVFRLDERSGNSSRQPPLSECPAEIPSYSSTQQYIKNRQSQLNMFIIYTPVCLQHVSAGIHHHQAIPKKNTKN
jgi:hypothetical protein